MVAPKLIKSIIESNASPEELLWLDDIIVSSQGNVLLLQKAFVVVPRHIHKATITLDQETERVFIQKLKFSPKAWTLQQSVRSFILLHLDSSHQQRYINAVETLFESAALNELTSLISFLPLLKYSIHWIDRAKEAVRSNMGYVFDAIAFNNPYPAKHFDEAAWNQLVLKTIFSEKKIQDIYGYKDRSNRELAYMIADYAHERWAADRPISPSVWELVAPFMDQQLASTLNWNN